MEELRSVYKIEPGSIEVPERASGMPKFPPGRYRQIDEFRRRNRRAGLLVCGDYLLGPFIEGAVTTGLRAAEAIQA
jgi:hypothetical protein